MKGNARRHWLSVTAVTLVGCNSVLGIEEPLEAVPVGAAGTVNTIDPGSGGTLGTVGVSTPSGDAAAAVDPSTYDWAEWPMPNPVAADLPNVESYDAMSLTGVVIDLITGLQWQQKVSDSTYAWADAAPYCEGLMLAGGGWRLPSRIELLSVVDYTNPNPVIDPSAFPDTPAGFFWTSSPFAGDAISAWSVNFEFGPGIAVNGGKDKQYRVRCVR